VQHHRRRVDLELPNSLRAARSALSRFFDAWRREEAALIPFSNPSNEHSDPAHFCLGIIVGLSYLGRSDGTICLPVGMTREQAVRVVVQYIDGQPARMNENFVPLAIEALQAAWTVVVRRTYQREVVGRKGEVCANRPTDPCLSKLCANRHFYLFEFIGQCRPLRGNQHSFQGGQWNSSSFAAFPIEQSCVSFGTKMGTSKDRRDQELLDKQMRRLTPPRNEGVIAVMLATMFLVGIGIVIGSVLSPHQIEPIQIASIE
jgi:Rap1a immunity proteins